MWHLMRVIVVVTVLSSGRVLAAEPEQAEQSPAPTQYSINQQVQPTPQGPEAVAPLPQAIPELVGYKPIPESMLPRPTAEASQVPAQPANVPVPTNLGGTTFTMGPYTLGRDDVVHIAVQGQPDFTGTYLVGPDGAIQYGFVGDIRAEGLAKDELAQLVTEKLKKYVRIPSVHITIVGFNSKAIYILGQVAKPGKYAMRGDSVKIRDAVIAAGLVTTHAALGRVHIITSDPNDPTYRIVNLKRVLYKGRMKDNIDLVNGDIVLVPSTVWGAISDFITSLTNPASKAGAVAYLAAL